MKIFVAFVVIMVIGYVIDYIKDRKINFSISVTITKVILSLLGAFALIYFE